jgi:hypothetical protein
MAGRPLAHFIESANELGDSLSAVLFQVGYVLSGTQ